MKKIELSEHFTKRKMLLYSLPCIFEAFATTSFQMVDGCFVSNLLGLSPFAAVEIISPVFFMFYALGFMFGEGGGALVSLYMGRGNDKHARRIFTMNVVSLLFVGAAAGIAGTVLMPQLSRLAGATDENIGCCIEYGRLLFMFLPAYLVNSAFMSLWLTAGKGWLGMVLSAVNGTVNVLLDWFFMSVLGMGVSGAALASSIAALIPAAITITYFCLPNRSLLRFARFSLKDLRSLVRICTNGISSMIDSVAGNVTQLLINGQLMRYLGEMGVAAMGVYDYVCEFFMAVLFGIATASVTVVGYKFGEKKRDELNSLVKTNTVLTLGAGAVMCAVFILLAEPVSALYVGYSAETFELAVHGVRIMSLSCIVFGFNLFVSSFFTGLENGLVSAAIALCGSLAAPAAMLFVMPALFGGDGIWSAAPLAALITFVFCIIMLITQFYRKKKLW